MVASFSLQLCDSLDNGHRLSALKRICRADKIAHDCIYLRSNTSFINVMTKRRFRELGYVLRRPPQELTHISLLAEPRDGWQKRGGPIKTWTGTVRKDFEYIGGSSDIWT
ncbi:unnamed protein product [Dracunculus medinensis]|uniref:HTH LytTR-type domain-containing protein n=1 Tax=Dracunculus medinensis TaxID=318479 RepID=A0A0N4U3Q9_DRAME|nr:unnamed protein product [Dracunculus medinensis]